MIDIEKLKKEIKGRIRKNVYLDYHEGYNDALKRTISIIESMEEESVSEDLEQKALSLFPVIMADKPFTELDLNEEKRRIYKAGANWQKEKIEKEYSDLNKGLVSAKGLAVAMAYDKGKEDMKHQMMKDAVEGTVEEPECLLWRIISDDLEGLFVVNNNLHDGDRVKIIIIKMD